MRSDLPPPRRGTHIDAGKHADYVEIVIRSNPGKRGVKMV